MVAAALRYDGAAVAAAHRHRRLQGHQRHAAAMPTAIACWRGFGSLLNDLAAAGRPRLPSRRRRVRTPAARTPTSRARASSPAPADPGPRADLAHPGGRAALVLGRPLVAARVRRSGPPSSRPGRRRPLRCKAWGSHRRRHLRPVDGGRRPTPDIGIGCDRGPRERPAPSGLPADRGHARRPRPRRRGSHPAGAAGALRHAAHAVRRGRGGGHVTRLDLACVDAIVAGAREPARRPFLTVNLAPSTLEARSSAAARCSAILARYEFAPDRLVIELTENQPLHDLERPRSRVEAFRRAGVRFAADDIGAGNAGLRLLAEIEFDVLKVDLSLVQRSASSGRRARSSARSSSWRHAPVRWSSPRASSVPRRWPRSLRLGITAGQGFFLGRPGPLEQAIEPVTTMRTAQPRRRRRRRLAPVDRLPIS